MKNKYSYTLGLALMLTSQHLAADEIGLGRDRDIPDAPPADLDVIVLHELPGRLEDDLVRVRGTAAEEHDGHHQQIRREVPQPGPLGPHPARTSAPVPGPRGRGQGRRHAPGRGRAARLSPKSVNIPLQSIHDGSIMYIKSF